MKSFTVIDLSQSSWTLACHRPFIWMFDRTSKTPELSIPARVPGSNLTALREAKIIEDWDVGLNSRHCEWTEHRHWEFHTDLAALAPSTPVTLEAEGLDHSGWILVDTKIVTTFTGSLVRHRFDLTEALGDGKPHRLAVIFDEPPREQGQIGYSSRSKFFKPRFAYSWDWVPRVVPVGIWDSLRLVTGKIAGEVVRVSTAAPTTITRAAGSLSSSTRPPPRAFTFRSAINPGIERWMVAKRRLTSICRASSCGGRTTRGRRMFIRFPCRLTARSDSNQRPVSSTFAGSPVMERNPPPRRGSAK